MRVHASSGTRHKPTIVAYTARDVEIFAEVNARAIACAGGGPEDVLHVAYGYGLFTGGLGLHYGGERLGATVVPASGGNSGFQVQLLADLGARGLCCTPSFCLLLAERAQADGLLAENPALLRRPRERSRGPRRCAVSSRRRGVGTSTRATSTGSQR